MERHQSGQDKKTGFICRINKKGAALLAAIHFASLMARDDSHGQAFPTLGLAARLQNLVMGAARLAKHADP
ncbi:MAG: hypothetical protein Q7T70_16505 [Polaromonas sp.]|nr:hypothetical protein [Polaromonas sp.]